MVMYIVRGLSFRFCFRLLTIWFSLDRKWRWKKMETFWLFVHRFPCTLDCAYDSIFLFSQSHRHSHDSAYNSNSDSIASENQPNKRPTIFDTLQTDLEQEKIKIDASLSVFTHVASGCVNSFRQKKKSSFPQDWFETPTWPPFYSFKTPTGFTLFRALQIPWLFPWPF